MNIDEINQGVECRLYVEDDGSLFSTSVDLRKQESTDLRSSHEVHELAACGEGYGGMGGRR